MSPSTVPEPCAFHLAYNPTCGACMRTNEPRPIVTTPEYAPEQVEAAKARLGQVAEDYSLSVGYDREIGASIRTILSALSKAEADSKRLDWVIKCGARHTDDGTSTDRDGYWYTLEWDFGGLAEGLSLREAIDNGMAKHAAQYGTGTAALNPEQCRATRSEGPAGGWRCVQETGHPGWHRDCCNVEWKGSRVRRDREIIITSNPSTESTNG